MAEHTNSISDSDQGSNNNLIICKTIVRTRVAIFAHPFNGVNRSHNDSLFSCVQFAYFKLLRNWLACFHRTTLSAASEGGQRNKFRPQHFLQC